MVRGAPPETTLSREVHIAALDEPDNGKSHILAGAIGEGSPEQVDQAAD